MNSVGPTPRVGLFVTCLVDLFRPKVGFAAVKLLEQAGCRVEVPTQQTCCAPPPKVRRSALPGLNEQLPPHQVGMVIRA